jgi:serine/threonine protein kinase
MEEESRDQSLPSSSSSVTRPGELPWRAGVKSLALFFVHLKSHLVRHGGDLGSIVWRGGPDSPVVSLREAWRKRDSQQWIHKWFGMYSAIDLEKIMNVEQDGKGVFSAFVVRDAANRPFFSGDSIAVLWDEHPVTRPDVLEDLVSKITSQETAWKNPATVVTAPRPSLSAYSEAETVVTIRVNRSFDGFDDHELAELLASLKRKLGADVEIVVEAKRRGSVILDLRLPAAAARHLLELFRAGDLDDLGALALEGVPVKAASDRASALQTCSSDHVSASNTSARQARGDGRGMHPVPSSAGEREPWDVSRPAIPAYEVLEEIGRGGMGVVWKARHLDSGEVVALKVLRRDRDHPDARARFRGEVAILERLRHQNVVQVRESGEHEGRPHMVMDYLDGRSLQAVLQEQGPGAARWLAVFAAVCQAVAYAHSQGVIHRDLKPSNVMVGAFGEVQVMDWGLAKVLPWSSILSSAPRAVWPTSSEWPEDATQTYVRPDESDDHTVPGSVMGTWEYMPPEQARGLACEADERSDVFGLGAMLCTILTGKPPYVGPTKADVIRQARGADLAGASARLESCGADADLIALARACLSADPNHRPENASVVEKQLTTYLASVQKRLRKAELARRRTLWLSVGLAGALQASLFVVVVVVVVVVMVVASFFV